MTTTDPDFPEWKDPPEDEPCDHTDAYGSTVMSDARDPRFLVCIACDERIGIAPDPRPDETDPKRLVWLVAEQTHDELHDVIHKDEP